MEQVRHPETGYLAVLAPLDDVREWATEGPVPALVVPAGPAWTLLCTLPETSIPEPFGHPAALLSARPLTRPMRPAFGVYLVGERAVLTLQQRRRWSRTRWLAWAPGLGERPLHRLPHLRPAQLVRAAPAPAPDALPRVEQALAARTGTAERVLRRVITALGLPGEELLADPAVARRAFGATVITPSDEALARFADTIEGRVALEAERRDTGQEEES